MEIIIKHIDLEKIKESLKLIKEKKPNVLVIGDIMLDQYIFGSVNRISPEAPVPVLNFELKKNTLGGAGNVVINLINLGAKVSLATIIGRDSKAEIIKKLLKEAKVSLNYTKISKEANSTVKTRYISKNTQLLRLDNDSIGFLKTDINSLKGKILKRIDTFDSILISDYNKGVCEKKLIEDVIFYSNKKSIPVFIDPKGSDWKKYRNAVCLTPNVKEVKDELKIDSEVDFKKAAKTIKERYNLKSCLITRGPNGMTYYDDNNFINQKVGEKEVFDVSGAGDTVISSLVAAFSSGVKLERVLELASLSSSEVVTHFGTTPFNKKMISNE